MTQDVSPVKLLHEFAQRNQIPMDLRLEKQFEQNQMKTFTVRLRFGEKTFFGTDRTLKLAQRAAAQLALTDRILPTAVQTLNQWAKRNCQRIYFVFLDEKFIDRPMFFYRVYLRSDLFFDGHGSSHHQARSHSALNALFYLRNHRLSDVTSKKKSAVSLMYERAKQLGLDVRVEWNSPLTVTYRLGDEFSSMGRAENRQLAKQIGAEQMLKILSMETKKKISNEFNPITRLYQLAQIRQVQIVFRQINDEKFTFEIQFGEEHSARAQGATKQLAKRAAAQLLLEKLEPTVVLPPPPSKGLLKRERLNDEKQTKKHVHFDEKIIEKDEQKSKQSSNLPSSPTISHQLAETCQRMKIDLQYKDERNENDQSGSSRYYSIVSLLKDDQILVQFRGQGPSITRAQENASSAAWNRLKQLSTRLQQR